MRSKNVELISYKVGKGYVNIPIDADPGDLVNNLKYSIDIVKYSKKDCSIRSHSNIKGVKNPELNHINIIGDVVEWKQAKDVEAYFKQAFRRKLSSDSQLGSLDKCFLALEFAGKLTESNLKLMVDKLSGKMKHKENLKFVFLRNGEGKIMKYTWKDNDVDNFYSEAKKELL
ncbi:MAG: hypothetical protein RL264_2318 [Bacteroidota bacterium]